MVRTAIEMGRIRSEDRQAGDHHCEQPCNNMKRNAPIGFEHLQNRNQAHEADDSRKEARLRSGVLADIAPTILQIMGVDQPEKMTGKSLLES